MYSPTVSSHVVSSNCYSIAMLPTLELLCDTKNSSVDCGKQIRLWGRYAGYYSIKKWNTKDLKWRMTFFRLPSRLHSSADCFLCQVQTPSPSQLLLLGES